jgi:TRAP-type transport system small permease protein
MLKFYVNLEAAAGKFLLVVIVVLVFVAGVLRWFDHPLIWSVDLAQLLFLWIAFIGADQALRKHAHIGMDLAVRWMPLGARRIVEIVLALLTLAFLLIMAWEGYKLTTLNIQRVFGDSGISYAFVTGAVPIGCLMLAMTLTGHLVRLIRGWRTELSLVFSDPQQSEVDDVL